MWMGSPIIANHINKILCTTFRANLAFGKHFAGFSQTVALVEQPVVLCTMFTTSIRCGANIVTHVTVRINKNDVCCWNLSIAVLLYCYAQMQLSKTQTQLRKIRKRSCSVLQKLMCAWIQHCSEEAFHFLKETFDSWMKPSGFQKKFSDLWLSCATNAFWKNVWMLASFFWRVPYY